MFRPVRLVSCFVKGEAGTDQITGDLIYFGHPCDSRAARDTFFKTRCEYLQRYAVLLRFFGLTPVRSTEAILGLCRS